MIEFLKVAGLLLAVIGIVKGVSYFCETLANNIHPTLLKYKSFFILFVICSMLWNFTDIYERLSDFTGIPLQK